MATTMDSLSAFLACYFIVSMVTVKTSSATGVVNVQDSRPSSRGKNCPRGWAFYKGWTYDDTFCYKYINESVTFEGAREGCRVYDAYVVDIQYRDEAAFVLNTVVGRGDVRYWIGFTDEEEEGVWKSVRTGYVTNLPKWDRYWHLPDGGRTQNCASTGHSGGLKWNDMPCSTLLRYVCKKHVYSHAHY